MGKTLVIAEKPSVGRDLTQAMNPPAPINTAKAQKPQIARLSC